jgi:gliding motility-associated-like protein
VEVNVLEAAVAEANGPYATCGTDAVDINATTNGTGQWTTSGTGTFADASAATTSYTPDPSEDGSTITLTWETFDPDGSGPCNNATATADLVITTPATAVPGGPYAICSSDIANIEVTTTPGDGTWSGGQGVFGDATDASTSYTPGAGEAGTTVVLTWTTVDPDGPAPCPQVTATVEVNVLEAATAEANGPYTTCATSSVAINATANGPGQWTVQPAGSGTFADNTATTTTFTPTVDPLVTTTVQVIWTTNDPDDAGPCPSAADAADVVINGLPVANAGPDVTIACGDTIDGSATLGTPTYDFLWSPATGLIDPDNASTPVILSGTYLLLVTDANGCTDTDSVNVTVTGLEDMALAADAETCLLVPVDLVATAGQGIPAHTFVWTPTTHLQPGTGQGPNITFTYSTPITQDSVFTLVLTVTDNLGCADTNQVQVTVHPLPVVDAGPDSSVCAYTPPYQLADFSPVAGPGTTGVWTPGQNVNPGLLSIGNNTFTYTFTDLNGCVNDDDLVVTVNEVPVAAFTMPDTLCVNTTFTPDNQTACGTCSNVAYLWNFGDGSPLSTLFEPQHSYADTGTYVVTLIASSGFGCADTITTVVEVIKIPEVGFTFTPEVGCGPLLVDFTNTSLGLPISYLWTIETLGTSTAPDPGNYAFPEAPCDSTYYTIQLTASNQCGNVTAVDSVKVYRIPIPELAVSSDTICSGVELEAYNATTCAWQTTYAWDFGNNNTSTSQDTTQSMVYTAVNDFATYVLILSAANQCGTATDQQTITVVPNTIIAFFTANPISGCEPLPVQFTQQMAGVTFFTWDFGDGASSDTQDPLHEYVSDGTYTATFTAGNFCGALDTMSQVITVLPAPEFDITAEPNVLCVGEATVFSAFGDPISGLSWNLGDGTGSSLLNPTHTYADSGLFVVSLSAISTLNGCPATATDTVLVLVTPDAQVTATPLSGCSPLEVTFLNTTTFASNFFWTFGDGNAFIGEQPQYVYTEPGVYTADLLATNSNGCADSASATITVHPRPDAAFTYVTDPSPEANLPVQFENASTGAIAYQWDLGDGTVSFLTNPMHTYALGLSCDFTPELVAFNGFGCTDTARSSINIAYDLRIWAPNAFRPDGDGLNEEFVIVGTDIEQSSIHLRIFNRWGELIHETKGREPRWDGRINGELAKNDVYVWMLSARTKCGFEDIDRMGHVTVIR